MAALRVNRRTVLATVIGVAGVVAVGIPVERALEPSGDDHPRGGNPAGNSRADSRDDSPDGARHDDIASLIDDATDAMSPSQRYRPPTDREQAEARAGFGALLDARRAVPTALDDLGFTAYDCTDPVTGRPYTVAHGERETARSWGLVIVDRSAPPSLVVEVPHPASDLHTEIFGLGLLRQVPGAVLVMAGAHRKAADNKADVAHETDSVFHTFTGVLADRRLPQAQLHGFHDKSAPDAQIIVSPGATPLGPATERAADELVAGGFTVSRAWSDPANGLAGRTNVQGQAAERIGTVFVHVEMARSVRDSAHARIAVVHALAGARLNLA